tara:strand:+ start:269 stop:547 length:279 start_codon:yes stop_codon:yes gene_type:complete
MDLAIENNAEDIIQDQNYVEIHTDKADYLNITKVLKDNDFIFDNAELEMHAETKIELKGDTAETFIKFIDAIEELDDVQNVYTNADYEVDLS